MKTRSFGAGAFLLALAALAPATPAQPFDRRTPIVVAVQKVGPAVVNILTTRVEKRYEMDPWLLRLAPRTYRARSLGSGVIIDPVGLVVTNEHVVRNATEIKVHLSDGRVLQARRLDQAIRSLDLALLQIASDRRDFPHVRLGRSADIMVGETVIALGNPFGLENTVTTGVISAKNRTLPAPLESSFSYTNLLQTDASINPGNSGGALVNINAELIGINTAIHSQAEGIGFAIPVDAVRTSVIRLLDRELASRGDSLGVDLRPAGGAGVVVARVIDKGPADEAGVRPGDAIREVGARRVRDPLELRLALYAASGQSRTRVRLRRAGRDLELEVARPRSYRERVLNVLAERLRLALTGPQGKANRAIEKRIGVVGTDLDRSLREIFHLPRDLEGVLVLRLEKGGPALELEIRRFDVILGFGRLLGRYRPQLAVRSVEGLDRTLARLQGRDEVQVQVYRRNEGVMYGHLRLR